MKCLTVLIIALVGFVTGDEEWQPITDEDTLHKIGENCRSGLSSEQNASVRSGVFPDEKEVHQYVLCHVKNLGIFFEDTGYSVDRILTLFSAFNVDAEKAREIVIKCIDSNEQKSTPAVWAHRGHICIRAIKLEELLKKDVKP